jgi:lysozyme family protein
MPLTADTIIDNLIRREGGYVNNPNDKGGPTKYGITLDTLSQYRKQRCTAADVAKLGEAEAREIYRRRYVAPLAWIIDAAALGLAVDMAVNHGGMSAARMLQRAARVKDDGVIGPATKAAVNGMAPTALFRRLLAERVKFYGRIVQADRSQAVFIAGWLNRVAEFLV